MCRRVVYLKVIHAHKYDMCVVTRSGKSLPMINGSLRVINGRENRLPARPHSLWPGRRKILSSPSALFVFGVCLAESNVSHLFSLSRSNTKLG